MARSAEGVGKETSSERFVRQVEAEPWFLAICIAVVYLFVNVVAAYRRPYWLDEIIALHVTTLPTTADIWQALKDAVDGNPPLYYLISRPVLGLFGKSELAFRLWSIVGGLVAALSVYFFVQRRISAVAGAIAALVFSQSGANYWSAEARPYALCLGLSGVAILCWQRCAEAEKRAKWLVALAICMAVLVSLHYYSALMVVPLLVGELVRFRQTGRGDWRVVLSLGVGCAALLLWLPILEAVRGNVAANKNAIDYFAAPSFDNLYTSFFKLFASLSVPILMLLAVVLGSGTECRDSRPSGLAAHETAMAITLSLYPIVAFVVALLVTHTFVIRYVLPCALGVGILFADVLSRLIAGRTAVATTAVLSLGAHLYWFGLILFVSPQEEHYRAEFQFLDQAEKQEPLVIAEGLLYPPMLHYAPSEWKQRLYYLTDLESATRYTDTTNERIMLALRPMAPDRIVSRESFVRDHRTFSLYSTGERATSILEALLEHGCTANLRRKRGHQVIYECQCDQVRSPGRS